MLRRCESIPQPGDPALPCSDPGRAGQRPSLPRAAQHRVARYRAASAGRRSGGMPAPAFQHPSVGPGHTRRGHQSALVQNRGQPIIGVTRRPIPHQRHHTRIPSRRSAQGRAASRHRRDPAGRPTAGAAGVPRLRKPVPADIRDHGAPHPFAFDRRGRGRHPNLRQIIDQAGQQCAVGWRPGSQRSGCPATTLRRAAARPHDWHIARAFAPTACGCSNTAPS